MVHDAIGQSRSAVGGKRLFYAVVVVMSLLMSLFAGASAAMAESDSGPMSIDISDWVMTTTAYIEYKGDGATMTDEIVITPPDEIVNEGGLTVTDLPDETRGTLFTSLHPVSDENVVDMDSALITDGGIAGKDVTFEKQDDGTYTYTVTWNLLQPDLYSAVRLNDDVTCAVLEAFAPDSEFIFTSSGEHELFADASFTGKVFDYDTEARTIPTSQQFDLYAPGSIDTVGGATLTAKNASGEDTGDEYVPENGTTFVYSAELTGLIPNQEYTIKVAFGTEGAATDGGSKTFTSDANGKCSVHVESQAFDTTGQTGIYVAAPGLSLGGADVSTRTVLVPNEVSAADDDDDETVEDVYGSVQAWGCNHYGQLGDGTQNDSSTFVTVSGLNDVKAIDAGWGSTYALLKDGTVKAWGYNHYGQLGDGTQNDSSTFVTVSGLNDVKAIAAGEVSAYALLENGTVVAWGDNIYGQLGNGTRNDSSTFVTVPGLKDVKAIAVGDSSAYALLDDGTVVAWGNNTYGQLGNGTTNGGLTPGAISGLSGVKAIAAGLHSTYALLKDGTVKAWGYNEYGQLGDGTTTNSSTPVTVSGLKDVKAIAVGATSTYALLKDGTVKAWGHNDYGQLGNGTTTNSSTPVTVSGLKDVKAIAAHNVSAYVLLEDGTVQAWGYNGDCELGDGTTTNSSTPVSVSGLSGVKAIAAGDFAAYAIAPAPTTTTLSIDETNVISGETVEFTAAVSPQAAGMLEFYDNGTLIAGSSKSVSSSTERVAYTATSLSVGEHIITAKFTPDDANNYHESTSEPETVTVAAPASSTTTTIGANPAYVWWGNSTTLTATVTPATTGDSKVAGMVEFVNTDTHAVLAGPVSVDDEGKASATMSFDYDDVGKTYPVQAVFTSDDSTKYESSASQAAYVVTVVPRDTKITLNAESDSLTYGDSTTLTATVVADGNVDSRGKGTVKFFDGNNPLGEADTYDVSTGVATLDVDSLSVGTHSITAKFTPEDATHYKESTSTHVSVEVEKREVSITTVAVNPTEPEYGKPARITATIDPAVAGEMEFFDGDKLLDKAPVDPDTGEVTLDVTFTEVGGHDIKAVFTPDDTDNYEGSISDVVTVTVTKQTIDSVVLGAEPTSITYGDSTTFTATVDPKLAGKVEFFREEDGGSTVGLFSLGTADVDVTTGEATLDTTLLTVGTHSITAKFTPDDTDNYDGATSDAVSVTVTKRDAGTTVVTVNPTEPEYGEPAIVTATIDPAVAGKVEFFDGETSLGMADVNTETGEAIRNVTFTEVGGHDIKAVFTPDDTDNYDESTSDVVKVTVTKQTVDSVTLSAAPTSLLYGDSTTLTATIDPKLAGKVEFLEGTDSLGTADVDAETGKAMLDVDSLTVGTHSITARFTPEDATHYNGVTSNAVTVTVAMREAGATTVTVNPTAPVCGEPVTITATTDSGVAGKVTFFDGDAKLDDDAVAVDTDTGKATLEVTFTDDGEHKIKAVFTPDDTVNHNVSTSEVTQVTVTQLVFTVDAQHGGAKVKVKRDGEVVSPMQSDGGVDIYAVRPHDLVTVETDATTVDDGWRISEAVFSGSHGDVALVDDGSITNDGYLERIVDSDATFVLSYSQITETHLSVDSDSVTKDDKVTFTATVSPAAVVGTVEFFDGDTSLGAADAYDVETGVATLATTRLSVGEHSITAKFTPVETIHHEAEYETVHHDAVTEIHDVFYADGTDITALGWTQAQVTAHAKELTLNNQNGSHGSKEVEVSPAYDEKVLVRDAWDETVVTHYNESTSNAVIVTVAKYVIGDTIVTVNPTEPEYGEPATVTVKTDTGVAGEVELFDGGESLGKVTVDPDTGEATFDVTFTEVGGHDIKAVFTPDDTDNYDGSTSDVVKVTVTKQTVDSVTLNAAPTSLLYGDKTTFTAVVEPKIAGKVEFFDGTVSLGTAVDVDVTTGVATFDTTSLTVGTHSITAKFTPQDTDNYEGTTSNTVSITVTKRDAGTTTVTVNPTAPEYGEPATVTVRTDTGVAGEVELFDGGESLGKVTVDPDTGEATFDVTFTEVGGHDIKAVFTPDDTTNHDGSTSDVIHVTVTARDDVSVTLSAESTSITYGDSTTLTATIDPVLKCAVEFCDGDTLLDTVNVDTDTGKATLDVTSLTVGEHIITAVFKPVDSAHHNASTSNTVRVKVTPQTPQFGQPSVAFETSAIDAHTQSKTAGLGVITEGHELVNTIVVSDTVHVELSDPATTADSVTGYVLGWLHYVNADGTIASDIRSESSVASVTLTRNADGVYVYDGDIEFTFYVGQGIDFPTRRVAVEQTLMYNNVEYADTTFADAASGETIYFASITAEFRDPTTGEPTDTIGPDGVIDHIEVNDAAPGETFKVVTTITDENGNEIVIETEVTTDKNGQAVVDVLIPREGTDKDGNHYKLDDDKTYTVGESLQTEDGTEVARVGIDFDDSFGDDGASDTGRSVTAAFGDGTADDGSDDESGTHVDLTTGLVNYGVPIAIVGVVTAGVALAVRAYKKAHNV